MSVYGTHSVVSVIGEIDLATTEFFEASMRDALMLPSTNVILDLGACDFIDSCGLGVILEAQATLAAEGDRHFTILPGPRHVQRVFEHSGVMPILPFAE